MATAGVGRLDRCWTKPVLDPDDTSCLLWLSEGKTTEGEKL